MTDHSGVRLPGPRARPVVSIRMLGAFAVDVDGRPVALPAGAQRLVALLALRGRTGRSRLAGLLWSGTTEHRALASLRTGIWRVNQAAPGLVVSAHGIVELGLAADVDVTDLIDRAHAVLRGDTDTISPVDGGAGPGELLPDWDDPWLDAERERLHQLRLHVLEAAAGQLAEQGHYGLALESALAALRADDLRESAHRTVISIHLAEGNVAEARRAFDLCRRTFVEELGIEPSSAVAAMLSRAAAGVATGHQRGPLHSVTRDA